MTDKTPVDRLVDLMEFHIETGVTLRDTAEKILADMNAKPELYFTDSRLDTAMKLLRDAKGLHIPREMNQADLDVLAEAKEWGK